MIEIVPATVDLLAHLDVQDAQRFMAGDALRANFDWFVRNGHAFAAIGNGRVLGAAGAYEVWRDRAVAWALLSGRVGSAMPMLHRAVERFLHIAPWARIEAHIDPSHAPAVRWAAMHGFVREGTMRKFFADRDFDLYARIR